MNFRSGRTPGQTPSLQARVTRVAGTGVVGLAILTGLLVGTGRAAALHETPPPAGHDASAAAAAVRGLTGDRPLDALTELPDDFESVMGYRPEVVDGRPVNPGGDCSSPVPLPSRFETLCRTHDFGYDLLRYADRTGSPLGSWARLDIDRMLGSAMSASCEDAPCRTAAIAARSALGINTWRQHDGPPVPAETAGDIVGSLAERGWATLVAGRGGAESLP